MHNKKIDFLITGLDYGGAETQVVNLLCLLRDRGWNIRLITLIPPRALTERLRDKGIPIISLGMRSKRSFPLAFFRLLKHLWRNRTIVLHAHMVHANFMARFVRYFSPIKILICSAHNIDEGGALREAIYKYTDFLSDITTNVSQAAIDSYLQKRAISPQKARLMYNGIDTQYFKKRAIAHVRSSRTFEWIAVGRLEAQKHYKLLLNAFALLCKRQAVILNIVGKGREEAELKKLCTELGIESQVNFLGVKEDIPTILSQVDAFVLSSAWEGYGLVVAEAMACELPVVVTDSGGPAEIVGRNEQAGYIVPPGAVEALCAAMERLMQLPVEQRLAMGKMGRERIEKQYALAQIVDRWEALYEEMLAKNVK